MTERNGGLEEGQGKPLRSRLCRHHWMLETPSGPTVLGKCRNCGTRRVFPTVTDDIWLGAP